MLFIFKYFERLWFIWTVYTSSDWKNDSVGMTHALTPREELRRHTAWRPCAHFDEPLRLHPSRLLLRSLITKTVGLKTEEEKNYRNIRGEKCSVRNWLITFSAFEFIYTFRINQLDSKNNREWLSNGDDAAKRRGLAFFL